MHACALRGRPAGGQRAAAPEVRTRRRRVAHLTGPVRLSGRRADRERRDRARGALASPRGAPVPARAERRSRRVASTGLLRLPELPLARSAATRRPPFVEPPPGLATSV